MRTPIRTTVAVAAIVLAAALIAGCENDLDPLAPSDGIIALQANPSTVVLDQNDPFAPRDPETGLLMATSNIYATVFDKTGHPLGGVAVYFTTTGGRLGSAVNPGAPPEPVTTNVNGVAIDTLTIKESDPLESTVTATSSIITKTVVVKRTTPGCRNTAPVANGGADQSVAGAVLPVKVTLDGRGSSDAENPIAELTFVWDCGNDTTPTQAAGFETFFPQVVACTYESGDEETDFDATLTVTDRGNGLLDPNTSEFLCKESTTDTVVVTIGAAP